MRPDGVGRRRGRVGPWTLREVELALPAGALIRIEGGTGAASPPLLRLIAALITAAVFAAVARGAARRPG
ncbi:hypothetical protein H7827_04650 [Streptomyces sp. JH002]|uniref:hypothetical protein n=1 Tax=Streptomyces sp. JH002 TaxID=2763259 RepID=UPI003D805717